MPSNVSLYILNMSRRMGLVQAIRARGSSLVSFMIFFQPLSTSANFDDSVGSCFLMSPDAKIDSRYIQFLCTDIHSSRVSWKVISFFCQSSTSSRMGPTKRLPAMVAMFTRLSSRFAVTSSADPSTNTSFESLYAFTINSCSCQIFFTLSSIPIREDSEDALPLMVWISSMYWPTPRSSRAPRVNSSLSISSSWPMRSWISFQCRGIKLSLRKAWTTGKVFLKACTLSWKIGATPFSASCFPDWTATLLNTITSFSMA
mmetsp:Transcript_80086/g.183479  ORF Transcript_80086/g.183479 Transcript_80086/m.183479 type:complete len:258 (-) Transcript_80086:580-1353(-)